MSIDSSRWEYGSDFHWLSREELSGVAGEGIRSLYPGATLWGSGRAALLSALEAGRSRGWERVLIPSYLCLEVRDALVAARWQVETYEDHPFLRPAGLPSRVDRGSVLLRVNHFGWRGLEERDRAPEGAVIEDHTHDPAGPWARASRAELCFASLRKTSPVPDGGVLWSPRGDAVPAPSGTTGEHATAALLKREGMVGKRFYLDGTRPAASEHKELLSAGERRIGRGAPSAPDPETVPTLDVLSPVALGLVRRKGFERIVSAESFPRAWLPVVELPEGVRPFVLVLDLGSRARRDRVARWLVRHRVFPTVLWHLDRTASVASREIAARTLTLPCDFRYTERDLDLVASLLAEAFARESSRETGLLAPVRSLIDRWRG